jgi:hypothetical protein
MKAKTTRQGVRDLNAVGPKRTRTERRALCPPHMPGKWEDLYDAAYGRIYGAQARFCTECGVMMESTDSKSAGVSDSVCLIVTLKP